MFGSNVLDTILGLAFVYLFISILVSAANELTAGALGLRAQNLAEGLKAMLDDPQTGGLSKQLLAHPLIKGFVPPKGLIAKIPLLNKIGAPQGVPSYIPARTFATALMDIIVVQKPAGNLLPLPTLYQAIQQKVPASLQAAIKALADESKGDMNRFKDLLENWFNDAMDRASGWYKRKIMIFTLFFGLVLSVCLNADTLRLLQRLYNNQPLQTAMSQAAQAAVSQSTANAAADATSTTINANNTSNSDVVKSFLQQSDKFPALIGDVGEYAELHNGAWWVKKIFGLLLTTLAVSLGASFWFQQIGRLAALAGPKPNSKESANVKQA